MPPINGWRSSGAGPKTGWHVSNQAPNAPAHGSYGSDTQGISYAAPAEEVKAAEPAKDEPKEKAALV